MLQLRSFWSGNRSADEGSALLAVGLDVKNDQEDRRNQNEQKAGDKSEIVGFHGRSWNPGERITVERP